MLLSIGRAFSDSTLKVPSVRYWWPSYLHWGIPSAWVGDSGTEAKNSFLKIFRLIFAILFYYQWLSNWQKIFSEHSAIDKNCLANTQPPLKIIGRELRHWQKLFPVGWSIGKNYFSHAVIGKKWSACALSKFHSRLANFQNFARAEPSLKNYFPRAEPSLKINSRELSLR